MRGRICKLRNGVVADLNTDIEMSVSKGSRGASFKAQPSGIFGIGACWAIGNAGLCIIVAISAVWTDIDADRSGAISPAVLCSSAISDTSSCVVVSIAIIGTDRLASSS